VAVYAGGGKTPAICDQETGSGRLSWELRTLLMAKDRRGVAYGVRGRREPGGRFYSDQERLVGKFLAQRAGWDAVRGRLKMPKEAAGCA